MLRSVLRPKAALHLRLRLPWPLLLLAALACSHSDPFQLGNQDPAGPRTSGLPRLVTYSSDPDGTPARSGDGAGWLYAFTLRPQPAIVDRCLAGLPLEGGGQTRTFCDVTFGRLGFNATLSWPAENRSGRLAYVRARGVPNGGATLTTDLVVGSFNPRDSGQILRRFPYHFSTDGQVRNLSHLGWLDGHTLIFLATDILHPGQASQDTLETGIQIERVDADHPAPAPDVMAGTANASSVDPAADGSGFYFTLAGDTKVYRRTLASGATSTVYDFGAAGIARDARMADSVLYAVVGGAVRDSTDAIDGVLQIDDGGDLTRVDLRTGIVTTLALPGQLARFPAVSGDHSRILVQSLPGGDLWLVGGAMKRLLLAAGALCLAGALHAQTEGSVSGIVRDAGDSTVRIANARITADGGRLVVLTDARGVYRLRGLNSGWHSVGAASLGHRPVIRDSVLVRDGQDTPLNFLLQPDPVGLAPVEVIAGRVDSLLDPLAPADVQRFTNEDLRRMPVTTVDEAIALSAGAVGQSYRGGRLGEQATVVDGLSVKNQLDASSNNTGLRIPPDMLAEGALVTNGISARYGQAVSALVELDTRDGSSHWQGYTRYETDRPLGTGGDYGLDRAVVSLEGGITKGVTILGVADLSGRLDADPVNAPAPDNPRDPRHDLPSLLPHNSGQQADLAAKLTASLGTGKTLRILGIHSGEERLLYDPAYKYDADLGPARKIAADLLSAHLQQSLMESRVLADLRFGYYNREYTYGTATESPDYSFGAFTSKRLHILGEDLARDQDTAAARAPINGYLVPQLSDQTPWGVPAFFMSRGSRGTLAWNSFRELRGRLDLSMVTTSNSELFFGGEYQAQKVLTFQRLQAFAPVGDSLPPPTAATFHPHAAALYGEYQIRGKDLGLTAGLRYDSFRGREDLPGQAAKTTSALSPRLALSTVLKGATVVVSYGKFKQAPDYQYLVDAAFDDTTRTGRFRRGNPDLGFEGATQYELSARIRPKPELGLRLNLYYRELEGLVASVPLGLNPDSSEFGNQDNGSVKGVEAIIERSMKNHWAARVSYTAQQAQSTSTSAFLLRQAWHIDPSSGDTIKPARVEFPLDYDRAQSLVALVSGDSPSDFGPRLGGIRPFGGWQGTAIVQVASGLPFSMVVPGTDSLDGLPNSHRLPGTQTVDLLIRKLIHVGSGQGSVYLDVRNVLNRRNIVAVRRDTGQPGALPATVQQEAQAAYLAHPEPIPYESTRYRSWADVDHDGFLAGHDELFPLYLAAAKDFNQPLFAYGQPRLMRLGLEVDF